MEDLILLHGAIGAKSQLQPLADALKNDFNVHSLNFPAHGGKPFPSKPFSIELFAHDVLDYMQQNRVENAVVFGYSMGGYVGMYMAAHFPGKISGLITLATKFYWDEIAAAKEIKMLDATTIQQKIPAFANELELRHAPQNWKELLLHTQHLLSNLGINNELKPADYSSVSTPCLLMLGDRDRMVALEETVNVYKQLPNASLVVLPGTPHPVEKTDPVLLSFFIRRFVCRE